MREEPVWAALQARLSGIYSETYNTQFSKSERNLVYVQMIYVEV